MSGILVGVGPGVGAISPEGFRSLLAANPWRGRECWDIWKGPDCMMAVVRDRWEEDDAFAGPARVTRTGPIAVVADASLYYRTDLRARLGPEELPSGSLSPQDLFVAAYRTFHGAFAHEVQGDYAVAVWDAHLRRLTLARDPFGLRSLYYRVLPDLLLVASTPHPLVECGVRPSPDREGILRAITIQDGDGTRTGWQGVWEVPAGSRIEIPVDPSFHGQHSLQVGQKLTSQRFWWPRAQEEWRQLKAEDAPEALAQLLIKASVARAVPGSTGIAMSGGQDSTSVFACLNEGGVGEVPILSLKYPKGDPGDEAEYVLAVAQKEKAMVHWVDPANAHLFPIGLHHLSQWSSPVGHIYEVKNRILAEHAHGLSLKVLQTGHGGDHVFWVDLRVLAGALRRGRWIRVYRALRDRGWRGLSGVRILRDHVLRPALPLFVFDGLERLLGRTICSRPFEENPEPYLKADPLLLDEIRLADREYYDRWIPPAYPSIEERIRAWPLLAPRSHRISAAAFDLFRSEGVEFRCPFLDRALVGFSLSRSDSELSKPGEHKALLGSAMRGRLPDSVRLPRSRKFKTGTPVGYFNREMGAGAMMCVRGLTENRTPWILEELGLVDLGSLKESFESMEALAWWSRSAYPALRTEMWLRNATLA